jgi:hypothetical protein
MFSAVKHVGSHLKNGRGGPLGSQFGGQVARLNQCQFGGHSGSEEHGRSQDYASHILILSPAAAGCIFKV